MSGAEGIAGLALSAVSVAALFTSCIDCFNIVVAAKDFGRDYELLCTAISIQKLRLFLWGESVGLASRRGKLRPYHPGLDDPLINPIVLRTLHSLNHLLVEARNIDSRYGPQESGPVLTRRTRALDLFKNSFEEFQEAVQQNQKQKSVRTVTRWALHDADKFGGIVKRLRCFIDGLQDITKALGVWPDQQARLKEEIESVADIESLRLIRDATDEQDVSNVASRQLQHCGTPLVGREIGEGGLDSETPTALLTLDFVVAQHNKAFSNALSLTSAPKGKSLLDLVVPAERVKVLTFLSLLLYEVREANDYSLARRFSVPVLSLENCDLENATAGFHTRSEHWRFRFPREQYICLPIWVSLARDDTYFLVLTLVEPLIRRSCAPNQASAVPPVTSPTLPIVRESSPMPPKAHSRHTQFEWSTPESFSRWFPSNETLFVRHDDELTSRNMCLNVLTATDQGFGPLLQLFYLRMYDLNKRAFSLRRYSRDSGLEVCRTSRMDKEATGARPRVRRSINSSINSIRNFSRRSSRSSQTSAQSSQSGTEYSNYSSESALNQDESEAQVSTSFQEPVDDTLCEQSSNQISLDFSNYARIILFRKAFGARKSYDFEYWGTAYQWKRLKKSQSLGRKRSYNLYRRGHSDLVVAHITLQDLTWSQTHDEEEMGGWVPPIWMRITDPSILSKNHPSDKPDVIIATGIVAFVDDCIRRRWNIPTILQRPSQRNQRQKSAETSELPAIQTEMLVRNKPATFDCTFCPKKFHRSYDLRPHLRVHTNECLSKCTVCGEVFNLQADCERHHALHIVEHDNGADTKSDVDSGDEWDRSSPNSPNISGL